MSQYTELAEAVAKMVQSRPKFKYYIFAVRKEVHLFGKRLFRFSTLTTTKDSPTVPKGWTLGKLIASGTS